MRPRPRRPTIVKKFVAELEAKGFERSQADPCVFRRVLRGKVVVIIVVYVDDLLMASTTKRDDEQALKYFHFYFRIKDLGDASYYLGCHTSRDRGAGTLKLDQPQHVQDVAERFGITKTSAISSATVGKPLSKADGPQTHDNDKEMRRISYREAVRALIWVATMTRSDLSFAAHQLAKIRDNPGPSPHRPSGLAGNLHTC